jgi:pimeloyl-ACP methyl ester carboxylesterase
MSKGLFVSPTTPPSDEDQISSTFILLDGRKLGYAQFGSLIGRPIIVYHGLACSRLDGAYFYEVGQQVGARIIYVDRPGMGWSSPYPNRTVLNLAKDVELLTEHLQLEEYCVMVHLLIAFMI